MSSIYCPECQYEIPVHDTNGEPVHEIHASCCPAAKTRFEDPKKRAVLLNIIQKNKRNMGLIE